MRVLLFALLLGACHRAPVVDRAELDRLRAEQRALAAKVEALQARLDRTPAPEPAPVATSAPVAAPPAPIPLERPLLTNLGTADSGAVVTTRTGALHTEDLHGAPIGGAASLPGTGAISDTEGAAVLEQLQAQMKELQGSQAAEQAALDQLDKLR